MHQLNPRFSTKTSRILAELAAVAEVSESPSAAMMSISEKLNLIRPTTLYHAYKIPGMTLPSILILLVYIKKKL